jgi:non-specific serine/threonine protein kinase
VEQAIGTGPGGRLGELVVVLPSTATGPGSSPQLLRPDLTAPDHRAPWLVPCVEVDPADSAEVLLALAAEPGAADSIRWLARSAELGVELGARGRVLPALIEQPHGYEARWRPVLTDRDRDRLLALAAAMPAAVVAGGAGGRDTVRRVVETVVDATARRAVAPAAGDQWFRALAAPDALVPGDREELAKLATVLDEWRRSAHAAPAPVRVCFRVEPPEPDEEDPDPPWVIRFLLQSRDDPSLLVPAAQLWGKGKAATALRGVTTHPHERLLEGLGRACRLCPELEPALHTARPETLELDAAGALGFLRNARPLLEEIGFGVFVPPWWRKGRRRLAARLRASSPRAPAVTGGGLGLDTLLRYEWEIAIGDETLSAAELRELARLKQPLVLYRGHWVELREEDLAGALRLLEQPPQTAAARDILQTALGVAPAPNGQPSPLPVLGVVSDGWFGDLLASRDSHIVPLATPNGFGADLRPYQERGLSWLAFCGALGLGACLADDMGLGKTAQLLALIVSERTETRGRRAPPPTLVVCPMSLVGNWQREAARFAPGLNVHVHHGADRLTGAGFAAAVKGRDLVLTTYNLVVRDSETLRRVRWRRVVLDEAQNIKNSATHQSRAVRSLPAAQRVALTGTPVENRLTELWSIMEFLNPGLLGSERAFREKFAIPIEREGDEHKAGLLRQVTGPFLLRRLKTDRSVITDLPEKFEMKVYCNLTREQATLYQAVVDDMMRRIESSEGIERRGLVLSAMMKLKQVCNHPSQFLLDGSRLDGRSGKLARTTEILEEVIAEGERALVFTQFAEMGGLLAPYLQQALGRDVLWLHGGTPRRGREEMLTSFQSPDGPPVFVLSIKAGGTGLNLTEAAHVIHFDRWWNPAVEDQATDRAFRIGQTRNVQVRKLVCVGTLEERIDAMIEQKRALAERIVGTGEKWLTELSTDALREILALTADAVAEG